MNAWSGEGGGADIMGPSVIRKFYVKQLNKDKRILLFIEYPDDLPPCIFWENTLFICLRYDNSSQTTYGLEPMIIWHSIEIKLIYLNTLFRTKN